MTLSIIGSLILSQVSLQKKLRFSSSYILIRCSKKCVKTKKKGWSGAGKGKSEIWAILAFVNGFIFSLGWNTFCPKKPKTGEIQFCKHRQGIKIKKAQLKTINN